MYESGYYPAGAEYDPRAPWNNRDTCIACAACDGKGYHWYAYDILTEEERECTEQEYDALPDTEQEAETLGSFLIKGEKETCDVCDGNGEVEYEPDYGYYDED